MNSSKLKPLLSLGNKLIGFILFVICAIAIYNKVLQNENLNQYGADLKIQLAKIHWTAWLLMGCLLTLNYTIEAIKWKSVIASTNTFNTWQALRAVLVGQAFSFFTPARSGDYVGRTLFLAPGTKLKGIIQMAWEDRTPFEAIQFQFGLKENPFASFTTENEGQRFSKTFIKPNDYETILENFSQKNSILLTGDRGSGKTALIKDFISKINDNNSITAHIIDFSSLKQDYEIKDFYKFVIVNLSVSKCLWIVHSLILYLEF